MCGFCAILTTNPAGQVARPVLTAMRDALEHRGPDDAGIHLAPGVGLGSRRLSIVDLSERGHMPMPSADQRYWITYNGEVYNHRELRADLEARGHTFRSGTDTEVVLQLFIADGPAMLSKLNGMFAFAIWDQVERTAFMARDRLGVKPFYYHRDKDTLRVASEPKALIAAGVEPQFDHGMWHELLCFRYVPGEDTPFQGIKSLLPGHYMTWRAGALTIRRWWDLRDRVAERRESLPADEAAWFRDTFDSAVELRRIADVPVGVMLSGGLDSSSVAASLGGRASGLHGFTVTFAEAAYDEGPLARLVAQRCGMVSHELRIGRDELLPRLRQASRFLDAPLAHTNDAHMLALSELAKTEVKVLLSGEGADETLNGYVRYQPLRFPRLLRVAERVFSTGIARVLRPGRAKKLGRMLAQNGTEGLIELNASDLFPSELEGLGLPAYQTHPFRAAILDEARAVYPDEPLRQAMYLDQHTFLVSLLDRNDRMTMGASIECRPPFLDYRLVETLAAMPTSRLLEGGTRKAILRRAIGDRLPSAIRRHKKWGFGIPWQTYFREVPELREEVARLPDSSAVMSGPLDRGAVRRAVQQFLAGDMAAYQLVRALLMVSVWYDECVANGRSSSSRAS